MKTKHHPKHQESQKQTVEIVNEPQIIEEQDEIIEQPEISKKELLLEKNRIHAKMFKAKPLILLFNSVDKNNEKGKI